MNSKKQNEQKQDSEARGYKASEFNTRKYMVVTGSLCGKCETKEHCIKNGCKKSG